MRRILALLLVLTLMGVPALALGETPANRIVVQYGGDPDCMDPSLNDYSSGSFFMANLFRGLYKYDAQGALVPAMAESVDVNEDATVYTFKLREGLMFSDGSPLTAKDFAFAWLRTAAPASAAENAYEMFDIKNAAAYNKGECAAEDVGVKVLDELTLEVTLGNPTPWFLALTATTAFSPLKQEAVDIGGNEDLQKWSRDPKTYVCNGPYMIKEMKPKESYLYVKNPHYYEADQVVVDELEYVVIAAPETALVAFENKEIDVLMTLNADATDKYLGTDAMFVAPRNGWRYYHFNCAQAPFDDARVRKALALTINRDIICNAIRRTGELPLYGFIPFAQPDLVDPSKTWREVNGNAFEEDIALAQQLLAEAGYPGGEGFPQVSILQTATQSLVDVAQAMQAMWLENLGINVEVKTAESGVYWSGIEVGNFDIAYTGYTASYMDPMGLLIVFETKEATQNNQFSNAEYDAIIHELFNVVDPVEREALFVRAEALLAEQFPAIPVYGYIATHVAQDNVHGILRPSGGHCNFEYATKN